MTRRSRAARGCDTDGKPGSVTSPTQTRTNIGRVERIAEMLRAAAVRDVESYAALVSLYEIGYAAGYADGSAAAEDDMAACWHRVWLDVRRTLDQPTYAELRRRRGEAA